MCRLLLYGIQSFTEMAMNFGFCMNLAFIALHCLGYASEEPICTNCTFQLSVLRN